MKTHRSHLLILVFLFISCVQGDDFDLPPVEFEEPQVTANFEISTIKDLYRGFQSVRIEAGTDSNTELWIEAYVVSSDESGNFYKTLIIQDSPKNSLHGISISTESTDLYTFYEPGRKIYFRVDGLFSGEYAGLPTIGLQGSGDGEVQRISIEEFQNRIKRSTEIVELKPKIVTIDEITEDHLNTFIQLQNVQFTDEELGNSYAYLSGSYSANRDLENCNNASTIILRTSGFSDFKNLPLPEGNGTINAIVSIFNSTMQLFIREPDDVNFTQARCE